MHAQSMYMWEKSLTEEDWKNPFKDLGNHRNYKRKEWYHQDTCEEGRGRQAAVRLAGGTYTGSQVSAYGKERKEVSIGPGSTGHEPGRTALVFWCKMLYKSNKCACLSGMPHTSFTNLRETARGENVCPSWVGSMPVLHNPPWNPLPHPTPSSHCAQCRALTHIKVEPGSPYAPGVTGKLGCVEVYLASTPVSKSVIPQNIWRK